MNYYYQLIIVIESGKQGDLGNLEGNMKFLKIYKAKITELCLESTCHMEL